MKAVWTYCYWQWLTGASLFIVQKGMFSDKHFVLIVWRWNLIKHKIKWNLLGVLGFCFFYYFLRIKMLWKPSDTCRFYCKLHSNIQQWIMHLKETIVIWISASDWFILNVIYYISFFAVKCGCIVRLALHIPRCWPIPVWFISFAFADFYQKKIPHFWFYFLHKEANWKDQYKSRYHATE